MLHPLIWPQSVKRTVVFPKTSRHLAVVTATGAEEQVVSAKVLPWTNGLFWHWRRGTQYSDQDRNSDDSSISTKSMFHNKWQNFPISSVQTDKDIMPFINCLYSFVSISAVSNHSLITTTPGWLASKWKWWNFFNLEVAKNDTTNNWLFCLHSQLSGNDCIQLMFPQRFIKEIQ